MAVLGLSNALCRGAEGRVTKAGFTEAVASELSLNG